MSLQIQSAHLTSFNPQLMQHASDLPDSPLKDRVCFDWQKIYLVSTIAVLLSTVAIAFFLNLPSLGLALSALSVLYMVTYDLATKDDGQLPTLSEFQAMEKALEVSNRELLHLQGQLGAQNSEASNLREANDRMVGQMLEISGNLATQLGNDVNGIDVSAAINQGFDALVKQRDSFKRQFETANAENELLIKNIQSLKEKETPKEETTDSLELNKSRVPDNISESESDEEEVTVEEITNPKTEE